MYVKRVVMGEKINGRFIRERNTDKNAEADGKRETNECSVHVQGYLTIGAEILPPTCSV